MKQLLILQFRKTPLAIENEQRVFKRSFAGLPVRLLFKNAPLDTLAWEMPPQVLNGMDGVVLGGSGDLDFDGGREESDEVVIESRRLAEHMLPFISYLEKHSLPTLGICYGHQLLSHTCGVEVRNNKDQAKAGTHEVLLTTEGKSDPLFTDIPERFDAQYGHKDSLSCLPTSAVLLGAGEQCHFSAVRLGNKRYSVQFHPELNEEDMRNRFINNPDFIPTGMTPELMVRPSEYATKVLHNFVTYIM